MAKGKNKPQIRFNEFTDVWEQRSFKNVFNFLQNNSLSRADLSDEQGYAKNVHYGDILVKFGEVLDVKTEQLPYIIDEEIAKKYSFSELQNGDIIIADAAEDETVGKCTEIACLQGEKVLAGLHTIPVRAKENFSCGYLGYYMNSNSYHNQLLPLMQGTKVSSISKSAIQDTLVLYPKSLDEQAEIGQYFTNLDNLITLHQRKYDQMVSVKKSMLEKLFVQDGATAPQIRFGDFTAPWRQVHLGDIVIPYADPVETPHNGYERLGIRSHGKGVFHEYVEAGKELDTAHMHRVASHNLIVNITFAWEHAVAITTDSDEGKLVSHRFPQFSMSDTIYDQFLKYLILDAKFRHHLLLSSPGGAGRNRVLKVPEMLEYEMMIPEIEEQRQIASYLNSLDDLIELYRIRLEKMKNIKTACLQKMFV